MAVWNPRANEIFASILELPPAQRPAFLERACGADDELRRQVEALLAAHAEAGSFLDQPALAARDVPTTPPDSGPPLPATGGVVLALAAASGVQLRPPDGEAPTPVVRPGSDNLPRGLDPAGRLQLHGEIARGGMGAVLKGRDVGLGRDLAVKVLLETHQGKTELVQRFVEEAQIAGQLQHPGVVPVYELGQFPDRRPYFTMKLVKGKTLAALLSARKDVAASFQLAEGHGQVGNLPPQPDLPRFVGIFGQVCNTLAYAHARGVIHRDLKPSNVMVGAFGEVQVMDWGLAKVLGEGGVADERKAQARQAVSVIRTQRSAGPPDAGSHTQVGTAMGTPAYMAPEQARGDADLVDERADVFGLGAILCEILTGQPPFMGPNPEAMRKAQAARLDDALWRLDGCGADAELVGLARRCLAAEPWDRPRDAGAVAAAVTGYQDSVAERLRQAEVAHAAEAARAEEARATATAERKARRRTRALAASVVALVTVAAVGGLWVSRLQGERWAEAARREAERRQDVQSALEKVAGLQKAARWKEAQAVLDQASERLGEFGPADLRARVEGSRGDLALVVRLDDIRQKRATVGGGYFDFESADQGYAAVFRDAGLGQEGDAPEAVASRVRGSAIPEQLLAALDDWARVAAGRARRSWVLAVARGADPGEWRNRFRDPAVWEDRAALERLAGELLEGGGEKLSGLSPQLLTAFGNALLRVKADAVPLLRAAQRAHPGDFWLNLRLGYALITADNPAEGIGYCRSAVALRPESEVAHNNLGLALYKNGQVNEAIREWRTAIGLDPKYATPHNNLGGALRDKGQLDEAIRECRTAIALDPKEATPHTSLGYALAGKGQLDEAAQERRTAIALGPKDAKAHTNLGEALRIKGQLDEAIRESRTAIALGPKDAKAHNNLGAALADNGQLDEATQEYSMAIALDPKYAMPHFNLGNALRAKGQLDEATQEYHTAIKLDPKDARPHASLGLTLLQLGRFTEAREATRRCLDLLPPSDPKRQLATRLLQQCEQFLALDRKLAAILEGTAAPANDAERIGLAELCQQPFRKRFATSARFYGEAFAHGAKLADDMEQQHRYNAACAAALAGCGQGEDARALPDKVALGLRRQALDWLKADLAAYAKLAERDDPAARQTVRERLEHWRQDADLAGLRDAEAVGKLPAGERKACRALWAEVEALSRKVGEKAKRP
jgi:serine/threonine-protein kinase